MTLFSSLWIATVFFLSPSLNLLNAHYSPPSPYIVETLLKNTYQKAHFIVGDIKHHHKDLHFFAIKVDLFKKNSSDTPILMGQDAHFSQYFHAPIKNEETFFHPRTQNYAFFNTTPLFMCSSHPKIAYPYITLKDVIDYAGIYSDKTPATLYRDAGKKRSDVEHSLEALISKQSILSILSKSKASFITEMLFETASVGHYLPLLLNEIYQKKDLHHSKKDPDFSSKQ